MLTVEPRNELTPTLGALVQRASSTPDAPPVYGTVTRVTHNGERDRIEVEWLPNKKARWHDRDDLRCGLRPTMVVQDVPYSHTRAALGEGVVLKLRTIAGREQVLVSFPLLGVTHWLPFERVKPLKDTRMRFELGLTGPPDNAERFRLRSLALAITKWQENTGSLSRLDIDPLPHQVYVVHHILASGNLNWMIADDVGLGKTIEVGMLLSALKQRNQCRRVLLITPAGLTNQWKEELHLKFGLSDFRIFGKDFVVGSPREWKLNELVIGSMDQLKTDENLALLAQAPPWDLVVIDEAHRMTRSQKGLRYDSSDRFNLASRVRKMTSSMVLLTATPHQGKPDRFQALLELVRPELKSQIQRIEDNPTLLREMVIRNNKADVIDARGNYVFAGKRTISLDVDLAKAEIDFDRQLQDYLRQGYHAGQQSGYSGNTIGFVMTVYRKLASSSLCAIRQALTRRLERLENDQRALQERLAQASDEADARFAGESEEALITQAHEFFGGEKILLTDLLRKADAIMAADSKLSYFLKGLVEQILSQNPSEKVLIFTEYRSTQDYLRDALAHQFGDSAVVLIHGGLNRDERVEAIARFEDSAQFLISTEAGGEGINLQRQCHIMVNYDLPWNPMRLVQRVGRLYRYGQQKQVVVFNVRVKETIDGAVVNLMYDRIDQVVRDLAPLGGEFNPRLHEDILGEFSETLDVSDLLATMPGKTTHRTSPELDDALLRAREATQKQRELFKMVASYDPTEGKDELSITPKHVQAFVEGMLAYVGITPGERRFRGEVLDLVLPPELCEATGLPRKLSVTFNRQLGVGRKLHVLDADSMLLKHLLATAQDYAFDGRVAPICTLDGVALTTAMLYWQNDQGTRMREEFLACLVDEDGQVSTNPAAFAQWLLTPAQQGTRTLSRAEAQQVMARCLTSFERRLGEVSNQDLHPENHWLLGAAMMG